MIKFSFKKLAVIGLSAAAIATLSAGAAGCARKSSDLTEPENIEIARLAPPDDGSLPTAHTCAENLAYVVYVFDNQEQYHSYSYGVTSASIATQTTRNFRDYKDGVLVTTDLTYSSMVKSGTQTCTVKNAEGEYEVYFRTSQAPEADTLPSQAVWSEEAPTFFNERSYHYTYGLLPNELFNYIVNENNIIDSEQITVNADGTYTQNFTLDPVASTYFYQFGMKTRGGLSGYPEFKSITFSVTFDGGWRILSANMHEVANVNKGIVVSSVSDFATEYWYGDDHFDNAHYAYYDSYYKQYLGDDTLEQGGSTDEKPVVDVTNVLSNGFSQIMNGGAQFEITANLGNNTYVGYAFVSLDLADPLGTLALKVSLGKTLKEQNLFIEYGNGEMAAYYGSDFALTGNLAEVKLALGQFGDVIDKITSAFGGANGEAVSPEAQSESEGSDPVSELMNAMVLTAGEKQAVLTLETDDLLGLGIGINARLVFGISNNVITFRGGTVGGLSVGGEKVDLGLTILTTTAPEISRPSFEEGANLADYIADVHSLLGADLIKITANLHGDDEAVKIAGLKNVNADVTAYADIDGLTVGADADVSYNYNGQKISASAGVWYGYDPATAGYGQAVVSLKSFNGAPVNINLKCDIKQVAEAISTAVTFAGGEAGASTDGLVKIINGALSADFSGLLTDLRADKASIKIGVSVDTLLEMFNVNAGVKFGSCTLKYQRGEGVYGGSLSASLPALGFNMSVCGAEGAVEQPDFDNCLDLIYLINDVIDLANARTLKANIALDGSAEGVKLNVLNGISANLGVYFNLENIAVKAVADFSYKHGSDEVSAKISAWYDKGETELGKIILSLDEINGAPLSAKVYCDVEEIAEAVTALLDYAGVSLTPFEDSSFGDLQEVITNVLGADFATLLPVLKTDANSLTAGINVDGALELFGVNTGVEFGNLSLVYDHSAESKLTAAVPSLGLNVSVSGAEEEITVPDTDDCLDLTQLVNTVSAVWEQVDGIIEGKNIAFEIVRGETFLSLDGIVVEIWGEGEICWNKGGEYVALDLAMSITEKASDVATFKFIYDKNAEETPLVRLALNEVGLEIYKEDITSVQDGFNDIYNKVMSLFGKNAQTAAYEEGETVTVTDGEVSGNDKLMSVLFGVLASDKWVNVLNDFTLTTNGKSVALSYLADNSASVEIGADGALTLYYDGAFGERFTLSGGLVATSDAGGLVSAIESKLESCNMSSSKEGTASFVRLAYDFLFEAIHSVSVKNILGSSTYAVTFRLDGNNCNIDGLENVYIGAEIYVTGEKGEQGKLAEADLNIDAAGVIIKLNVVTERRGNNTCFYINLSQVADIKLPDLKIAATQESLYQTFEVLFDTVNNTDVLEIVGKLLPEADNQPAEDKNEIVITDDMKGKIADILTNILNFNFSQAVNGTEVDGVLTATIDLDNVVSQLGFRTGSLGTVEAVINHNSHSMKTSGKALVVDAEGKEELKEWISLSSELTARRDYSKFERADYISIEFLPTLIDDLVKVASKDGKIRTQFTLSGSLNAKIVNMLDVNIDTVTVTAGIDGENGLVANAVMHVNKTKVLGMGISEGTVGLTYRNGMLTLARGLNTASPEYKIMTFDYFMDHMLSKNSVLEWWLQISGWDMIMSFVKAEVNSGLTTTQDVYLYNKTEQKTEQEISMYDFVDALRVVINGNQTAVFGNYSALESDLGVYDNYYGFALNANKVTNGVLTKLNAAITRNDAGLDRVKASGAIQSYVSFSADLQFNCDWSEEYITGTSLTGGKTAPDVYGKAMAEAEKAEKTPDFTYNVKNPSAGYDEVFGCFSITNGNSGYAFATESSNVLYSHILTVVGLNGEREEMEVRHGSTVYLYDNAFPVYADANKTLRLLYTTEENGELCGTQFIMNGDTAVYATTRASVSVIMHNGNEEITVNSFVGDKVPTSVAGLETLGVPEYSNGTPVGATDVIDGTQSVVHIYGTFVESETVINFVKYTFSADTLTYTASGKAAGFNDYYSVKGNTLVLENEIGGYPVTEIAASAFENTEGKPIRSVIVPENITKVGAKAFAYNIGMERAVFLADNVEFGGTAGKDNNKDLDQPFYGCSVTEGGTSTILEIYYGKITFGGSETDTTWTKLIVDGSVIKYRYYIGGKPSNENGYARSGGGALYPSGTWNYADCKVNVDLNGVAGSTLTEQAIADVLAPYFPAVLTGSFEGSVFEATVKQALEIGLANFDIERGGILYTCVFTASVEQNGSKVTVTYNVSYNRACTINVYSALEFTYYGVTVKANTLTEINIPVDGDEISLATPEMPTHFFLGWQTSEQNGKTVYTASWREKATFTFTYKVSGNLITKIYDKTPNKTVSGKSSYSASVAVLEGQTVTAVVSADGKSLTIYIDGAYYTEIQLQKYFGVQYTFANENFVDGVYTVTVGSDVSKTFTY